MDNDNTTPAAVSDASHVNAPDATETVKDVSVQGMTLDEINKTLGKNFPTKEAALKSFKDTFSYVGKKTEDIKKEVLAEIKVDEKTNNLAKELEEMRKERFYDKNPQYAESSIRKFIEKVGGNPADVVNSVEFKEIFTKISGYDESQKLKTVLESNSRLSSSRDSLTKARELLSKVSDGQPTPEVEALATSAVKEAFGL